MAQQQAVFEGEFNFQENLNMPDNFFMANCHCFFNHVFSCGNHNHIPFNGTLYEFKVASDTSVKYSTFKPNNLNVACVGFHKNLCFIFEREIVNNYNLYIYDLAKLKQLHKYKLQFPNSGDSIECSSAAITFQNGKFIIFLLINNEELCIVRQSNKTVSFEVLKRPYFNAYRFCGALFYHEKRRLLMLLDYKYHPDSVLTYNPEKDAAKLLEFPYKTMKLFGPWNYAPDNDCLMNFGAKTEACEEYNVVAINLKNLKVSFTRIKSNSISLAPKSEENKVQVFELSFKRFVIVEQDHGSQKYLARLLFIAGKYDQRLKAELLSNLKGRFYCDVLIKTSE